ncbi:MAG: hypothetical protein OXK78_19340 [Caldilineaceae bacterium]|nr:hypothetical protein [Caldilineaceae bacterium]
MSNEIGHRLLVEIARTIEIPDSAYEAAEKRYEDLGGWFARPESECSLFDPHVHAQGSFRLGTVIRPISEDEAYDLDLSCKLQRGISKASPTGTGQDARRPRRGMTTAAPPCALATPVIRFRLTGKPQR